MDLPIRYLLKFSLNNTTEAFEIRWRLFSLISWLAGNNLIDELNLDL